MRWLRFVFAVIVITVMSLVGALLAVQNPHEVPLDLLIIVLPPKSIALWVLVALGLGAVLGMIVSGFLSIRLQARLRKTRRKLSEAQMEVDQLRRSGLSTDE